MGHYCTMLTTAIVMFFLMGWVALQLDYRAVERGYLIIGKDVYKLTKVEAN